MSNKPNPFARRTYLIDLRKRRGLTQADLAKKLSVTPSQISRWESAVNDVPSQRCKDFAAALDVNPLDMWKLLYTYENPFAPAAPELAPTSNGRTVTMEGASEQRMVRDIPLFGTALGSTKMIEGDAIEQTTLNTGDIIGYVRRPVILDGRADAYGLYVSGSSMSPAYEEGDMLLAETKRPPRVGDDVVVYLRPNGDDDDGDRARAVLVKRLVRRTASHVELQQFNPAITFRLPAEQVVRMDRILRLVDLID